MWEIVQILETIGPAFKVKICENQVWTFIFSFLIKVQAQENQVNI